MERSFSRRVMRMRRTAQVPSWATPAIVALGLLAAMLEGAGLYLFIPLVQHLSSGSFSGSTGMSGLIGRGLEPIPEGLRVPVLVTVLCASVLLKNLVAQVNLYVTRYVNGVVAHRLRTRIFRQTLESCIDYRVSSRRSDIVNTLATNTWNVGVALSLTHRLLVCACTVSVFLGLLLLISARMTAVAVMFLGISAFIVHRATRKAQSVGRQVVEENKAFGLRLWESISGLRLIRSFSREAHEARRIELASDRVRQRILKMDLLWSLPAPISEICGTLLIGTLILTGTRLGVGVASMAAFLALLYRMQGPMRELMSSRVAFDSSYPAVEDVAEFLERTREPYLANGSIPFDHLREGIEFRQVTFRYEEGDGKALDSVSFKIPRGKTTAIVGRSGAGKSTLMDLLFRFRDPSSGSILVDGRKLTEFDIASWRGRLSVMSQDVQLFNDSAASNIGYGCEGAGEADIREAARVAGADDFIVELPEGYDTILGDEGVRLSGGQRQRIALARTILRNPDILLLDEATNALDNESERLFQAALQKFRRGRTVVVIAHRLSTVEDADQIVVIESGRVVECGTPAALLASNGAYARLRGQPTVMPV